MYINQFEHINVDERNSINTFFLSTRISLMYLYFLKKKTSNEIKTKDQIMRWHKTIYEGTPSKSL